MKMSAQKNLILEKINNNKISKAEAARKLQVSRKTIYKWLKNKSKDREFEKYVLRVVIASPKSGPQKISRKLKKQGYKISTRSVWLILKRMRLNTKVDRENYALNFRTPKQTKDNNFPIHIRLNAACRKRIIEDILSGENQTNILNRYKLSRKTISKWKKRYINAQSESLNVLYALKDQHPEGSNHPRGIDEKIVKKVLNLVAINPEYSTHKIASTLGLIGNHGVQRILERNNLSLYELRKAYSEKEMLQPQPIFTRISNLVKSIWNEFIPSLAPAPPPSGPEALRAGGRLFKPFLFASIIFSVIFLGLIYWIRLFQGAGSTPNLIGLIFASTAFFMGSVFFLYSFKYYLTLAIVLSFSQQEASLSLNGNGNGSASRRRKGFLAWILGLGNGNGPSTRASTELSRMSSGLNGKSGPVGPVGLEPNLEHVSLKRHPYFSIHIPFYNEKNVVERAIAASTNFDYKGDYEVILCDDSTDETTQIIQEYLKVHSAKCEVTSGDVWTLTQGEVRPGVTLKHLHRVSRSGFKGGALRLALKVCDPRTEFISIFDADFVPYPDTLELFLKYFKVQNNMSEDYKKSNVAAVCGYQWHVLNKSENWITRGVRSEYSGSYVIERSGTEIYGGMKLIHGSVYAIRRDALEEVGWETSITEDFELTLKLYNAGYKVVYTPYIQAPAECVSTLKRLIRQRMRWAEGHSHNVRKMFGKLMTNPKLTAIEKLEFLYLSPYYLQAFFFLIGTFSWLLSETVFPARLPFWTSLWGWSLVLTNLFALPLMNAVGLFLEESEERDYLGLASFVALSYIMVPFQAYASIKGFLETEEGPWFRTPKTGRITDIFTRGKFYRFISGILPGRAPAIRAQSLATSIQPLTSNYLNLATANNRFDNFKIRPKNIRWVGNVALVSLIIISVLLTSLSRFIPLAKPVSASSNKFSTLSKTSSEVIASNGLDIEKREVTSPVMVKSEVGEEKSIEYIFHPEPRVRTKYQGREIETTLTESVGFGRANPQKAFAENGFFTWQNVFPNIDQRLIPMAGKLQEEIVIKQFLNLDSLTWEVNLDGLTPALGENEIYFAPSEGGHPLFIWTKPYLYEKGNPEKKSYGVKFELLQTSAGWEVKKVLTQEGKKWLADPARIFPVVLDPTQVTSAIESSKTTTELNYASVQRKIAYSTRGAGTDGWYAVYNEGTNAFIERCLVDTNCDASDDWTDLSGVAGQGTDLDSADTDELTPSLWLEGTTLWIAWFDNSRDNVEFKSLDTTNDTFGTNCTGTSAPADPGSNSAVGQVSIAVADDGVIYTAMNQFGWVNKSTSACSHSAINTGSGLTDEDEAEVVTKGNNLWMVFQDDTNLSLSIYVNDASPAWDTSNMTLNANTDTDFSFATDGTDFWVIQATTPSGADLLHCGTANNCNTTTTTPTWTTQTDPFTGLSAGSDVSVGYITSGTILVASIIDGTGTGEVVNFRTSTDNGANWSADTYTYGFVAGASGLDRLTSTMLVTNDTEFAANVLETTGTDFEFSTLPENLLPLLLLIPILPVGFKKLRGRRRNATF